MPVYHYDTHDGAKFKTSGGNRIKRGVLPWETYTKMIPDNPDLREYSVVWLGGKETRPIILGPVRTISRTEDDEKDYR